MAWLNVRADRQIRGTRERPPSVPPAVERRRVGPCPEPGREPALLRFLCRQWRGAASLLFALAVLAAARAGEVGGGDCLPLEGVWHFALDRSDVGMNQAWFEPRFDRASWRAVTVPHTWQVEPGLEDYHGVAWYARAIPGTATPPGQVLQLEFDAVNRDAVVWLNGHRLGEHIGSGYTPFSFPAQPWRRNGTNLVVVRVDNRFSTNAFPYERSFDWPHDGGIIRRARLRGLPAVRLGDLLVHAEVSPDLRQAAVRVPLEIVGAAASRTGLRVVGIVTDPSGRVLAAHGIAAGEDTQSGERPLWSRCV